MIHQNSGTSNVQTFQFNPKILPKHIQQELHDYYLFLVNKYVSKKEINTKKEIFFSSIAKHRYSLPTNYKFDRESANER